MSAFLADTPRSPKKHITLSYRRSESDLSTEFKQPSSATLRKTLPKELFEAIQPDYNPIWNNTELFMYTRRNFHAAVGISHLRSLTFDVAAQRYFQPHSKEQIH